MLREPRVRAAAWVPLGITAISVLAATFGVFLGAESIWGWSWAWLPWPDAASIVAWLWVGPVRAVLFVVAVIAFAVLAAMLLVGAFLVANLLSLPFLELLSRRVEEFESGGVVEGDAGWGGAIARPIVWEVQRLAWFLGAQAVVLAASLFFPPLAILAPVVTVLFLPFEASGPTLDRRMVPFRERRRWLRESMATTIPFGVAALGLMAIPLVNLMAAPVLVTAGTLLVVRFPPGPRAG